MPGTTSLRVRSIATWYYCIASRVRPSALIGLAAAPARALGLLEVGDGLARLLVEALRHAAGQDERGIRRGLHRPAERRDRLVVAALPEGAEALHVTRQRRVRRRLGRGGRRPEEQRPEPRQPRAGLHRPS